MPDRQSPHVRSLLYLILSASGLVFSLTFAGILLLTGVLGLLSGDSSDIAFPNFTVGWTFFLVGVLLVPGIIHAIARLGQRHISSNGSRGKILFIAALGLWIPLLALGILVAGNTAINWLLIPFISTILVAIPVWVWVRMGSRTEARNKSQTIWSLLGVNLLVTPVLVLVLEISAILLAGITFIVYLVLHPELLAQVEKLANLLSFSGLDPVLMLQAMKPFLQNPWVLFGILSMTSVLIPIIEELIKPIWLWMFVKEMTPTMGFFYGMLSGAAFALVESLGYLASPMGDGWSGLLIGRVGTGVLHVTASGLVGWGLGCAWKERKYLQLGMAYFLAVFLHGVWNALGILMGWMEFIEPVNALNSILIRLGTVAPFALIVLVACMLGLLLIARKLLPVAQRLPESEMRVLLDETEQHLQTE